MQVDSIFRDCEEIINCLDSLKSAYEIFGSLMEMELLNIKHLAFEIAKKGKRNDEENNKKRKERSCLEKK